MQEKILIEFDKKDLFDIINYYLKNVKSYELCAYKWDGEDKFTCQVVERR